ncbi:permease [Nitratifractor sp.]|uniref:permease n=1 Tax=Nitratifractor sp. TaxID=2268144 RepID=UPI00260101FB|nr:permease [Nitratifractor sp.]
MSRERNRPRWRGLRLLGLVSLLYLGLALAGSPGAGHALHKMLTILATLLPILAVVVFIAGAINYFLDPKVLAKHLGEESGWRGWMIALGAGVLSHGPMYAWYPVIEELRRHGMRDGLVAAFFYARAIKVPLLPMMAAYFGLDFTILLTGLTLVAAWGQGVMLDALGTGDQ